MDQDQKSALLEELRAKHGKVFEVEDEDFGLVVFRRPTKLEFRAFKEARDDDTRKSTSDEVLAKKIVVYPDPVSFDALIDTFPVLASNVAGEAMRVSGGAKLEVKKH